MFLTDSFVVMASFNKLSSFLSSSGKLSESSACIVSFPVVSTIRIIKNLVRMALCDWKF